MTAAQQERERDSDLDEIWCVLDHDERAEEIRKFREWLERHSSAKKGSATISAAISVPCFEYWLLLHFTYTDKPFHGTPGGPSACKQVIRELGTHLHGYQKADPGTYDRCREHTSIAIWNAKRSQRPMGASSTNVWELIEKLQELGTTKRKRDEG